MKYFLLKFNCGFLLFLCSNSLSSFAQENSYNSIINSEENSIFVNSPEHPCITNLDYEILEKRLNENILLLKTNNKSLNNKATAIVSLGWPLKASTNLHDCSFYHVSAHVDQNTTSGVYQDFNCGTKTYDGHRGTDISIWPFNFYKMDNNLVEVIAAAPGVILDKHDGEFDRNCSATSTSANYVVIQHTDGSIILYFHMKNGSITSKTIGQSVLLGEYLGIVGSSGSSSGPHLHFEVWSGSTVSTRVDPFSGPCNILNATSWWTNQKPHKETSILKASVHTTDIVVPNCPTTETLNESNLFHIPFSGPGLPVGYAKFYIFLRDEINGLTGTMSILRPDASTYLTWTYTSVSNSNVRSFGWSKVLPIVSGMYTFTATYNGVTCSTTFEIDNPTGISFQEASSSIIIYPNPSNGTITLNMNDNNNYISGRMVEIHNVLGKTVYKSEIPVSNTEIILNVEKGIYFYKVKDNNQTFSSGKIIVQ